MKYVDMGHKMEAYPVEASNKERTSVAKVRIDYPHLSFVGDQIPDELKDVPNDGMCRLEIIVRKTGDSIDTYAEDEPRRIEVEVQKMAYIGKGGKATKDEYLSMDENEREEYDKRDVGADDED